MSNITLNIVEPASPTPINPVDPGTGTVVPNTGLFTSGIGGAEAAVIATIALVVILTIVGVIIYYRKHKQSKVSNIFAKCGHTIKSKKHAPGLAVLALLVSIGTVAGLLKLGASATDDSLTVTTSSEELTIELADEPVFAVLPVELTVAEATEAGYTLTAYTDNTDLVSASDSSKVIPMVVAEESELVALADNTYGLALVEPEDKDSEVYAPLSTDSTNSTFVTDKDYKATEENDTTTIYYGFYITPDTPYGTYTGSSITYQANPNYITTLSFNGNGSDGGVDMEGMTLLAGDTITLPQNTYTREGYTFTGWNTEAEPTEQEPGKAYADQAEYTAPADSGYVTLYAQWKEPPMDLTFTAGEHISTLIVADSLENWKPYYMSSGSSKTFTAPTEGTKYMVTVVPEPGYVLSSDTTNSSYVEDFATGTLVSKTLLTTTYVAGSVGDNITISAALANTDDAHPAYISMQDLTVAQCPAYTDSLQGINVTDARNNKSYTVAKFGNYCYMLSNIKLDGNTTLTPATSHVASDYTLPADTGSGGWTYNSCQPTVASVNGEYYYNWPAATARVNSTSSTSDCDNDIDNSVGDICPAGWILPTYQDITPSDIWDNGANPSMLYTAGQFYDGSQGGVGSRGELWSSLRDSSYSAMWLNNSGTYVYLGGGGAKGNNQAVRCMRSS